MKGMYVMVKIHLSRLLGERRITQAELSRMTGIRPATIHELYNETAQRIKFDHLELICRCLHCQIHELIEYIPQNVCCFK